MSFGILQQRIEETPIAVIDFETTGLTPGADRVVEVSVVRIDPGCEPTLVFDTLVNPLRKMSATEIHGISDADVTGAPCFSDIAGDFIASTTDCVIAAFNVYFDIKFLDFELRNVGVDYSPPHFCLMYMRTMLGLGPRCRLEDACTAAGIDYSATHKASDDAVAAARLFEFYRLRIDELGVQTYSDLASLRKYKFSKSFDSTPFPDPAGFQIKPTGLFHSRAEVPQAVDPVRQAMSQYWETLKMVLADLTITDEEMRSVMAERKRGGLKDEQIRVLHARAFSSVMAQFASDNWIDEKEVRKLRRLHQCLEQLGWAPGH